MTAKALLPLVVPALAREIPPRFLSHKQQCGVTCETKLYEPNTGIGNTCKPFGLGDFGSKEESNFKTDSLFGRESVYQCVLLAPLRS